MSSKKASPVLTLCRDCAHARPVTDKHLNPEGGPIFCTCDFVPFYHFIQHNITHRNCEYYDTIRRDNSETARVPD